MDINQTKLPVENNESPYRPLPLLRYYKTICKQNHIDEPYCGHLECLKARFPDGVPANAWFKVDMTSKQTKQDISNQ